ncbi:MAG: N-acetyltransferase, partial [Mycobacterium sp.]|nr:N-acetyltransferase [Mycobacterium sp.]
MTYLLSSPRWIGPYRPFGGLLVYGKSDNRSVFTHTFVTEALHGRGLSKFMIRGALDDIRAHGRTLTNYCPAIDRFIEQHPRIHRTHRRTQAPE